MLKSLFIGWDVNWLYFNLPLLSLHTCLSKSRLVICLHITVNQILCRSTFGYKNNIAYSNHISQRKIHFKMFLLATCIRMNITRHGGLVADLLLAVLCYVTKTRLFEPTMCFFKFNSWSHNIFFHKEDPERLIPDALSFLPQRQHWGPSRWVLLHWGEGAIEKRWWSWKCVMR